MKKVAHITTISQSLTALLLHQMKAIKQADFEVYGISADGPEVELLESNGIKHLAVPFSRKISPFADLLTLYRLYKVIKANKFDIVHTHTPKGTLLGQIAAWMAGVPRIISTSHGYFFHENMSPWKRWILIRIEKFGARFAHLIFSQNQEDIDTAIRVDIARTEKLKFLGNGIDLKEFDPEKLDASRYDLLVKELSLGPEDLVVGFVGRLAARRKGFLDFLNAARIISEKDKNARFLVIGEPDPGWKDAVHPDQIRKYGLGDRILMLGKRPYEDLPYYLSRMNVMVLPSLFEGIPRVLMEASAMQVPIVATDVRGNREAVFEGENGFLTELGNVQALSDAILRILSNPELALRMGRNGRKIAVERFDEQKVFEKVIQEYVNSGN